MTQHETHLPGSLEVVHQGGKPPCLAVMSRICRGCSGWRAMVRAARPGGPWHGAVIHCTGTGLTVRSAGGDPPK